MADTEERDAEAIDEIIDAETIEEEVPEPVSEQALVIREERETLPAPASVLPSPKEWEATMAIAREIAATQFVPESYRGKPESVVAAILAGREMGIGPMQALRQIHMIDGRPAFSADLMMAKMRAGGVVVLESSVDEKRAYIKAKRRDTGEEAEVEWTVEDAEKAGLLSKRNWKTYPGDMLWARAVGRLARRLGSDLLGGMVYAKEEMEDWDDGGYGGAYGYDASTTCTFDPEQDLLAGAIQGKEAPKQITAALNQFDPTVDWQAVVGAALLGKYDVNDWRKLSADLQKDFWRRMSNAVRWIENAIPSDNDFPPVPAEMLVAGFAYAFSGQEIEITYKEIPTPEVVEEKTPLTKEQAQEAMAAADDVPWPDDEKGR